MGTHLQYQQKLLLRSHRTNAHLNHTIQNHTPLASCKTRINSNVLSNADCGKQTSSFIYPITTTITTKFLGLKFDNAAPELNPKSPRNPQCQKHKMQKAFTINLSSENSSNARNRNSRNSNFSELVNFELRKKKKKVF